MKIRMIGKLTTEIAQPTPLHGTLAVVILEARQVGQVDQNHGAGQEPLPVADPKDPFSIAQVQRCRCVVLQENLKQDLDHCR